MKIYESINFGDLDKIDKQIEEKIITDIKNKIQESLKLKIIKDIIIKKHPGDFYQIEFLNNEKGTVRLHYYYKNLEELKIHRHGGDLFSIILNGKITNIPYKIENIPKNNYNNYFLLEEIINRGNANENNREKLYPFLENDNNIIDKFNLYEELENIYSKKILQEFAVQYKILQESGLSYPFNQVFLKELTKEIYKEKDSYLIPKELAHIAKVEKDSITVVFIEKDNGKLYSGGPYRQVKQKSPDNIENEKIIIYEHSEIVEIINKILNILNKK